MKHLLPLSAFAFIGIFAFACAAAVAASGLSAGELHKLRAIPFAVVPATVPAGFHGHVTVNASKHAYTVVYTGPGGATIRIAGNRRGTRSASGAAATAQPRGLFQKLAGAFSHFGHKVESNASSLHGAGGQASRNANADNGKAGEEQEEMTAVSADSPLLGPVNFQRAGKCLSGYNDPSKAAISNASFTVAACNLHEPDALIRAYRSLERVSQ